MGAVVEEKIEKSFMLDEIRLRKLVSIIEERLGSGVCLFNVFRGDAYSYETKNLDDIINEDNDGWKSISKLIIKVNSNDIELVIEFKKGLSIYIDGSDRDEVFLLYSDIKEYIYRNIITNIPTEKTLLHFILAVVLLASMLFLSYGYLNKNDLNISKINIQDILNSEDINYKLNYLIQQNYVKKNQFIEKYMLYFYAFMIITMFIIAFDIHKKIIYYFFPQNAFLFGGKKEKYNKRLSFLKNIFWVVLVGGLVALLINIISFTIFQ